MINRRNFLRDSLAVVSLGITVPSVFGRAVVAAAEESRRLRGSPDEYARPARSNIANAASYRAAMSASLNWVP